MAYINIKGVDVLIDDDDFDRVSKLTWSFASKKSRLFQVGPYFRYSKAGKNGNKPYSISMHRFIIGAKPGQIVDHINGNPLDNRKSNLRAVDWFGNARNITTINKSGGIRGITVRRKYNRIYYEVVIRFDGKQKSIGTFKNEMIAEYELMKACEKYHGEFSRYRRYKISTTPEGRRVLE